MEEKEKEKEKSATFTNTKKTSKKDEHYLLESEEFDSELTISLKQKVNKITKARFTIEKINTEVTTGFNKLKNILESRYELSETLRDFNTSSKNIILCLQLILCEMELLKINIH